MLAAAVVWITCAANVFAGGEVRAVEPSESTMVGPRPVFRFTVKSGLEKGVRAVIEVSRDRWKSVERTWDSRDSLRGWTLPASDEIGQFLCPEALPEGAWEWRVHLIGVGGQAESVKAALFKVDATPPSEIEGLKVTRKADGSIVLNWEPVLYDLEGKPENVDHYVVYRYEGRGIFPQVGLRRIGQTTAPTYIDRRGPKGKPPARPIGTPGGTPSPSSSGGRGAEQNALYYKVVAVDTAGNELGLRDHPPEERADPSEHTRAPAVRRP